MPFPRNSLAFTWPWFSGNGRGCCTSAASTSGANPRIAETTPRAATFLITFTLYAQRSHRDHFRSTREGWLFYLVLPPCVLVLFALFALFDLRTQAPLWSGLALGCVRMLDFHHVGRQSYGVLQLLRDVSPRAGPKLHERRFFDLLAGAQWLTFALGGHIDLATPWFALSAKKWIISAP